MTKFRTCQCGEGDDSLIVASFALDGHGWCKLEASKEWEDFQKYVESLERLDSHLQRLMRKWGWEKAEKSETQ